CSIRPPRGTAPAELRRMAKIALADATARATAAVAPKRVPGVSSSDPEVNDGCLVWPFDLRLDGEKGVLEVLIDAGDGKVLSARHPDD
ncbi:MAG TPA: PepSY domain-containing protein, partial [Thermoanaerobaculia bacterium]|nr:PepSY domain-containing protein [Thermoanaerobaculia bacterium]